MEYTRQWAVRCHHESKMHERNSFITLTYNDRCLPKYGTLKKQHWQEFAQRLRDKLGPFRYMHCGEYGPGQGRPHYHASIFGLDFEDKKTHSLNKQGDQLYKSDVLNDLWGKGYCVIGDLNFTTARYVAQYMLGKAKGDLAEQSLDVYDPETGELFFSKEPEYATMSRRPGIGKTWIDKFMTDVYPSDQVIIEGHPQRPPKYYDTQLALLDPELMRSIKIKRQALDASVLANQTADRLNTRERIKLRKLQYLSLRAT